MYDGAHEHYSGGRSREKSTMHFTRWNSFLMSLMSPTGYAAIWALAAFLIPVTKHSPILDWLRVTPIQAIAFHRVAGWTSLFFSILHGFLHLRHLMDVLNTRRPNPVPWYQELKVLLIPPSWECITNQNPFEFHREPEEPHNHEFDQCWLALVNATGMVSTLSFVVLGITSLPYMRRRYYALFYQVHIPAAWIMLFMAIWHYPTCALVLIPNIIYYLSFNVPVYVEQVVGRWSVYCCRSTQRTNSYRSSSPLVESRWIQGGAIELIFATDPNEPCRHESRFVNLSHPLISIISHPFSIFSRQGPTHYNANGESGNDASSSSLLMTHSILFRPTGPFTNGLAKVLFSNYNGTTEHINSPIQDVNHEDDLCLYHDSSTNGDNANPIIENLGPFLRHHTTVENAIGISPTTNDSQGESPRNGAEHPNYISFSALSNTHDMIQFDSYYAGSHNWIEYAMSLHDELLLVAGGVGIAPFLDFLSSLVKRIETDTVSVSASAETTINTSTTRIYENSQYSALASHRCDTTEVARRVVGPTKIQLHWYCREVGLASYIWHTYLQPQVQDVWEITSATRGRIKIHIHLTSSQLDGVGNIESELGRTNCLTEAFLTSSNTNSEFFVERNLYCASTPSALATSASSVQPVRDARIVQSWWMGLLLPGSIMLVGTIFHIIWYKQVITNVQFRGENLIIRGHSVIFALGFAVAVSFVAFLYLSCCGSSTKEGRNSNDPQGGGYGGVPQQPMRRSNPYGDSDAFEKNDTTSSTSPSILTIFKGRTPLENIIRDPRRNILKANHPGVYMCGPHSLMDNVESVVRKYRKTGCAFYREDSEI